MKFLIQPLIFVAIILLSLLSTLLSAQTSISQKAISPLSDVVPVEPKSLLACGHPFYPPVSWVEQGQLTGLAPEVTQILFAELGIEVILNAQSNWKRCLLEIQQGRADIVVAAYRIDSREEYMHYSRQFLISDAITLFVNREKPTLYRHLDDLRNKTVGLLLGDSFGDEIDHFIQANSQIEYVSQGRQNFEKLALGRIDFMPVGKLSGQLQSEKLGLHKQVRALDKTLTQEQYFLGLSRKSKLQQYLPYIDRRLKEMHRDGTIERLIKKYSRSYLQRK